MGGPGMEVAALHRIYHTQNLVLPGTKRVRNEIGKIWYFQKQYGAKSRIARNNVGQNMVLQETIWGKNWYF